MRYCKKCVTPDTRPDLSFDSEGVCDACRSAEKRDKIDWAKRRKELEGIVERYRNHEGSNYDCIIPVSGGKNSMWQTYMMKKVFNMNPLCVTFAQCSCTELGQKNMQAMRELGVDHIVFHPNPRVYKKLFKKGLVRVGDPCWPCHIGIYTLPVRMAASFNVPLIVWGENPQSEYGGPATSKDNRFADRKWLEEFGSLHGNRVEDMLGEGVTIADLIPYIYPSDEEIHRVGVTGIFLGYFLKWDGREQAELVKKYGWHAKEDGPCEGTYTTHENLDGKFVGIHDYLMYLKYGFGRATTQASIDVRNEVISREEALKLVREHEGKVPREHLKEFLKFVGISEEEFFKVMDSFTNKAIFKKDQKGKLKKDVAGNLEKIAYDN